MAGRKLDLLDSAAQVTDLRVPPGNRLEALSGSRKGQSLFSSRQLESLDVREDRIRMTRAGEFLMRGGKLPRLYQKYAPDRLGELLHVLMTWDAECRKKRKSERR